MDRRERAGATAPVDALAAALFAKQTEMWTALPGVVKAFRKTADSGLVVDVQPSIQMQYRPPGQNGAVQWLDIPLLLDCPVMFPGGGGFTLTFPIVSGDECLVVFASRCIDAWFESGGTANQQAELRLHDLSDGFAFVGVRSKPRTLNPTPSAIAAELRSDDGDTKISVRTDGRVYIVAPTEIKLTAPLTTVEGNLHCTGNITADGDVVADTVSLQDHVHSGVDSGSSNSGPPVP